MSLFKWKFLELLESGTPVDSAIGAGDTLKEAAYKLQGQLDAHGLNLDVLGRITQGTAAIDMGGDNYSATEEESQNGFLILTNVGDGSKTFTLFPSPKNPTMYVVLVLGVDPVYFEAGSFSHPLAGGDGGLIIYTYSYGYSSDLLSYFKRKRTISKYIAGTSYTMSPDDLGKLLIFRSATPVTVTVDSTISDVEFNCEIMQGDTGQITFVPDIDVDLQNADGQYSTYGPYAVVKLQGAAYGGPLSTWQVNLSGRTAYAGAGGLSQAQVMARLSIGF